MKTVRSFASEVVTMIPSVSKLVILTVIVILVSLAMIVQSERRYPHPLNLFGPGEDPNFYLKMAARVKRLSDFFNPIPWLRWSSGGMSKHKVPNVSKLIPMNYFHRKMK